MNSSNVETWGGLKKQENRRLVGANRNMPGNYRLDADFENAGVAIVVKNTSLSAVKNVKQINRRAMTLTFASYGVDVTLLAVYAQHSNYETNCQSL